MSEGDLEKPKLVTSEIGKTHWNYEYFREYIRGLTRGKEYLIRASEFPDSFNQGDAFNRVTRRISEDSEDGIERYSVIGFKEGFGDTPIIVQMEPDEGLPDRVPEYTLLLAKNRAKRLNKIDEVITDIHSHPEKLFREIWGPIKLPKRHEANFSTQDLYEVVGYQGDGFYMPMRILVEGSKVLYVFKSRETLPVTSSMGRLSYQEFNNLWGKERERRELSLRELNMAIADAHRLVFYEGEAGGEKVRKIFPPNWLESSWDYQEVL